ncbi:MAG: hypothetical protein HZA24_08120 [Nitrospirae bacterium]|nr:hypothetical protein [Nitrospirota bacterium]
MHAPHILILDPAPARAGVCAVLRAAGYLADTAAGLHDAMVQCIIRNPALIVADLTTPNPSGSACRERLQALPPLRAVPFLTIGGPAPDLPDDVDDTALLAAIRLRLPAQPPPAAEPAEPGPAAEPPEAGAHPPPLDDVLERLARDGTDATLAVTARHGAQGEVLVRAGTPIHAVTTDGRSGPAAMAAIRGWRMERIDVGPPPRAETPTTLVAPTTGAAASDAPATATAQAHGDTSATVPADAPDLAPLLGELAALGIIRKARP